MKKLLFIIACATFSLGMNAADFYVSKTGNDANSGDDWDNAKLTIGAAVILANTNGITNADNVYVKEGTYNEKVLLNVNVSSSNKSDKISLWGGYASSNTGTTAVRDIVAYPTIIDGTGLGINSGPGLSIGQPSTRADGLIIQNWTATGTSQGTPAGLTMGNTTIVSNCIIRNNTHTSSNTKGSAGGIYITGGTLQDCEIYGNVMTNSTNVCLGGAIQAMGGTINRCKIYNNKAGVAGGIFVGKVNTGSATHDYLAITGPVTISNCAIFNNAKEGVLVGLLTTDTRLVTLTNNTIVNNESKNYFKVAAAASPFALSDINPSYLIATNNIFSYNGAIEDFTVLSSMTYNAINMASVSGTGNIALANTNTAAGFVSPSGVTGYTASIPASVTNANWNLAAGSVCMNVGTGGSGTDIAGNPRVFGSVDMGAYESTGYFRSKVSGNWATLGTWQSSTDNSSWADAALAVPNSSAAAINVLVGHEVTVSAAATASTLTVNAGGKLTLNSGITLSATNLTLKSDVTNGTATYKPEGTGALVVTGTTNVEQYFGTAQYKGAERNWYISSPLASASSSIFTSAGTLWKYNEPNTGTTGSPINTNWDLISTHETMIGGYIFRPTAASPTITLTGGALNTGSKTVDLYRSATANTANKGFNLIGNPYPSYLNAMTAINAKSELTKAIWYRTLASDKSKYYFESVVTTTGVGTNNALTGKVTGYIPPMQAFWVKTSAATTLTFDNSMRAHAFNVPVGETTVPTTPLKVSAESSIQQLLRLQVSNGASNDETIVYFHPNASNNYDNYDAPKRSNGNVNIPEIYTLANSEKLVINGMNELKLETEIPVVFSTGSANNFTIKATELSNFQDTKIILTDKQNPTFEFDLTDGTAYSFSSDVANDVSRFSILFRTPSSPNAVNTIEKLNAKVFVNAANQITIVAPEKSKYAIYNAVGMLVDNGQTTAKLQTTNCKLQTGVYVVRVANGGRNYTSRVIIK
ncbi:MAG: T9SS type A sorting domain-containing protein [Paludibacter sp.]